MPAGRQRSFDKEKVLDAAMLVFWRNGYAGSSLADLTGAMEINKPSLYATFGNKEQLFVAALTQYTDQYMSQALTPLLDPNKSLAQRLEAHLQAVVDIFCNPNLPSGCFIANSTTESAGDNIPKTALNLISALNEETKGHLFELFSQEFANGTLNSPGSPHSLALYFMSINSGLATLARSGVARTELDEVITHAISTIC